MSTFLRSGSVIRGAAMFAAALMLTLYAAAPAQASMFGDLARRWAALTDGAPAAPLQVAGGTIVQRCVIGKISYCGKYGGSLCERNTTSPKAKADCARWRRACVACHNEMPGCLGGTRTNVAESRCTRCKNRWNACMAEADSNFWPNRSRGIRR